MGRMQVSDNVGVSTVYLYRDGSQVWSSAWNGYPDTVMVDTGLQPNTTYTWLVRATDAAGNMSSSNFELGVTGFSYETPSC